MPTNGRITRLAAVLGHSLDEGRVFFVKPTTDTGYTEWYRKVRMTYPGGVSNIYNTFETAEAACTSNNNDTIILGTHGSHAVAEEVAVDKNRMHILSYDYLRGVDRRSNVQGAKITLAASVDAVSCAYFSGVRQTIRGVKFISSSTQTTAANAVRFGGEGLYAEGCSVQYNARLNQTTSWDALIGTDTGEFVNCTFGNDAVLKAAANGSVLIDAISTPMKHTVFRNCTFKIASSDNSALLFKVNDTAAMTFLNEMYDCSFLNTVHTGQGSVQLTVAAASASGLTGASLHIVDPATNAASFMTTSDRVTVSLTPTATTNAFEGVTPA